MTQYAVYRWYGTVMAMRIGRVTPTHYWLGGREGSSNSTRKIAHSDALAVTAEAAAKRLVSKIADADRIYAELQRIIEAECRARIGVAREARDARVQEILRCK